MIHPLLLIRRVKNLAHFLIAIAAVVYFRFPSRKIKIIGVTGTDGKTTTSNFIYQLLKMSGKRAALISTTGMYIGNRRYSVGFHVTTPSSFGIQKYLKHFVDKGLEYAVLEVSSHAIDQHRILGVNFAAGVVTNISSEHLDYHHTIQRYMETKVKLLNIARRAILNKDDSFYEAVSKKNKNKNSYTFSLTDPKSDLYYEQIKNSATEKFTRYNKSNLLASFLALKILGIDIKDLRSRIGKLELPVGRLQVLKDKPYTVIIDFAHTPNAFDLLLQDLKRKTEGRLIHVFGSAGKRDRSKRPFLGEKSSKYADVVILTAEDPRSERVEDINNDVMSGMDKKFTLIQDRVVHPEKNFVIQINDRKEAISFALYIANTKDVVVITGKGHEDSLNMGDGEIPWSDIDITKELLKRSND